MFLFARPVFNGFKYTYIISLYTTPYVCYSVLLSALNIFALNMPQRIRPGWLPRYPHPRKRPPVALVIGEIHNPATWTGKGPALAPYSRTKSVPIFGAIGSGKTSCCIVSISAGEITQSERDWAFIAPTVRTSKKRWERIRVCFHRP